MIHPLFMRLAAQPSLFTEHALAYAELARAEAGLLGQRWLRRGVLAALGLGSAALSLGLAGVAALLAASLPLQAMPAPWALWAVPLAPALLAAACTWLALSTPPDPSFPLLRRQIETDAMLFHEVDAA
ncbi:MAG: hypothetical protein IPH51_20825 [Rubrivivax sp.]|nr:hypothetical protein [Rubrivivax sp.]